MLTDADQRFWDNFSGRYEDTVVSIYEKRNALTEELATIENTERKIIADFGCGHGYMARFANGYARRYFIDYSSNMLRTASRSITIFPGDTFIHDNIVSATLDEPAQISVACNSLSSLSDPEFEEALRNIKRNTAESGIIYLVCASLEFRVLLLRYKHDYLISTGYARSEADRIIGEMERHEMDWVNGRVNQPEGITQKHWLRDELTWRLSFIFKRYSVNKLKVEWSSAQRKETYLAEYPRAWYWLAKIWT